MINGTFGWAGILGANMLSGGPAYPLATPGVRVAVKPTDQITALPRCSPAIRPAPIATTFRRPAIATAPPSALPAARCGWANCNTRSIRSKNAEGLPGVYKLGGWYATTDFADQHYGLDGAGMVVSLANPAAAGPLNHRGDWGIYGIADQMVWRADKTSLNLFLRGGFAPSDRNLISFYADGGFGIKGPFAGRADDVLTFGVAYAKISKDAAALDQDTLALNGPPYPIRDEEVVFEASYQAQIAPWWTVQPDLQYIVHPGGNVPDPNNPNMTVGNAFVAGVRSTIKF